MSKLVYPFFVFLLFLCSNPVYAEKLPLTLQEAERSFLERNLLLIAEKYNIEIADAEIVEARLFENPVISVDHNIYNRNSGRYFDFGAEGQTEVELEQVIYLAGQRNKRVKLEKINKETAILQFEDLLRTLKGELHTTFVELFYALKSQSVYTYEINSLSELLNVYREQYEKGNISLLEKNRLEALLLSLRQERNEWNDEIISLQATLRLLTGIPVTLEIEPLWDEKQSSDLQLSHLSFSGLLENLPYRPDIRMSENEIKASQANVRYQRSLAAPEFSLRGTYDRAGGIYENYFALGMSLSIPVFNRNQGQIKSAKASVIQNDVLRQQAYQEAENELFAAYTKLQQIVELYQSVNSEFEKEFESLLSGVDSNFRKRNISLLEFVDYYESYKEMCLQIYAIRKDLFLAMADINILTGNTIFDY